MKPFCFLVGIAVSNCVIDFHALFRGINRECNLNRNNEFERPTIVACVLLCFSDNGENKQHTMQVELLAHLLRSSVH